MQGEVNQLISLKNFLNKFVESRGLKVNFDKFFMVPINIQEDSFTQLGNAFGCSKENLPFTYIYISGFTLKLFKTNIGRFLAYCY